MTKLQNKRHEPKTQNIHDSLSVSSLSSGYFCQSNPVHIQTRWWTDTQERRFLTLAQISMAGYERVMPGQNS